MKLCALCADLARWQARRRRDDPALVGKRETPRRGLGRNFVHTAAAACLRAGVLRSNKAEPICVFHSNRASPVCRSGAEFRRALRYTSVWPLTASHPRRCTLSLHGARSSTDTPQRRQPLALGWPSKAVAMISGSSIA